MSRKRRGRRMEFLDMIVNLRKDNLATKRYLADKEVELANVESRSANIPPVENYTRSTDRLNIFADKPQQSIIDIPTYIPPSGGDGVSDFVTSYGPPTPAQSSNKNMIYIALGVGALLLFGKKIFK